MATYKLDNQYANYAGHWTAATAYALGKRVIAESANAGDARKYVFECTTGGTSQDPGPPTWDTTPGNTTDDGTCVWTCREATVWTNAHGRADWILLRMAAGDTLHADDSHNETHTGNITLTGGSTPKRIINVDKADDSTSVASKARIQSDANIGVEGVLYAFGIELEIDVYLDIYDQTNDSMLILEKGLLDFNRGGYGILIGGDSVGILRLLDTDVDFASIDGYFLVYINGLLEWFGGSLTGVNISKLIGSGTGNCQAIIRDVDLSTPAVVALVSVAGDELKDILFERCKLNAATTITTGAWVAPMGRVRAHHCSNAANTYEFYESYCEGTIEEETTVVRAGGASDGTTPLAWKMTASANVKEYTQPLVSPPITRRNATTGSAVTATVYFTKPDTEGVDYDDDEVWIEVEYPANDGGKGLIVFDRAGCGGSFNTRDPQATPAAQADDTSDWGGADHDDNPQKCHVTFTPALAGPVTARVFFAKASKVIFVDPKVYLS